MTPPVRTAVSLSETGYVAQGGLIGGNWAQWEPFEPVPDLQWPYSIRMYWRMERGDTRVTSVLEAIGLPIRQTQWRISPNGARDEVVEFVSQNFGLPIDGQDAPTSTTRSRDRFSWDQHLFWSLQNLQYGHCVDYDTEILTARGWIDGHALREGDQVLTFNPESGLAEWQPCEKVHRWSGEHSVRVLDSRSHSSVTTLNHKWITRAHDSKRLRFRTSAELNTNDRIIRSAPVSTLPREQKWSDAFVELVAWYWTDGHEHRGGGSSFYQSETVNPDHCQRIRAALTSLFGPGRSSLRHGHGPAFRGWRETRRPRGPQGNILASWYLDGAAAEQFREVAPRGRVRGDFISSLTQAQLRLFLETSIDGNGTRGLRGGLEGATIFQRDEKRLDAFEMACSLLGMPWTRSESGAGYCTRIGTQSEIRPIHSARRADNERATDMRSVVTGVWCPQVPNRTWLARRRGTVYFTGNSLFEQVYRRNPTDGRFWIRKLAPRPQRSIMKWNVALDGGLVSVTQMPPSMVGSAVYGPAPLEIPINRLVVYPRNMDPGQWIGKSILRPAYKNWLLKDELMRIEAATARRNGMGVPVATAPENEEDVQQYTDIASNFSAGDSTGVGLPAGASLKLLGVSGNLPDLRQAIEYHDTQIAIGALAHFLNLDGKGGSYALASVQANAFVDSVQTHAQSVRDIAQAHILEDLIDINFGVDETAPLLTFDPIGSQQDATAAALNLLVQAGLLSPDALTERSLRQRLGLPAREPAAEDPLNPIPGSQPGEPEPSDDPDDPDSSGDSSSAIPRRTGIAPAQEPWRLF